jgi:hypothetical protein
MRNYPSVGVDQSLHIFLGNICNGRAHTHSIRHLYASLPRQREQAFAFLQEQIAILRRVGRKRDFELRHRPQGELRDILDSFSGAWQIQNSLV